MAHISQKIFFRKVRKVYPDFFKNCRVLDIGSLNINGYNKPLFNDCEYIGIDIGEGPNVDVVCKAHEYDDEPFDTIISSECFEHDMYLELTLKNAVRLLKPGGLFAFSCANKLREPHGTRDTDPDASPFTSQIEGWCDYYRGLDENDIREILDIEEIFGEALFTDYEADLYFCARKKAEAEAPASVNS